MALLFGSHMSSAGGAARAVAAAHAVGFATVQLFTKNNNRWDAPALTEDQIVAFRDGLARTGLSNPVAHNSYLINMASPDDALWARSIAAMSVEMERAESLGIGDLVCHPGAHVGSGEEAGIARIVRAIDELHRRHAGFRVRIDLETTAGQGTCLGHRFEQLGSIIDRVDDAARLGVCVDTCHIFAAGYDFATPARYNRMIENLDRAVDLRRVRVWHLNDSLREFGSRVDRHAHIGRGFVGEEAIGRVVRDERFASIPMILETPKGLEGGADFDAMNLATLRRLSSPRRRPKGRAAGKTPDDAGLDQRTSGPRPGRPE